jgi:predicted HicB family RNase H-like nuclease
MLKYKGYTGHVEFDDESGIFHGEVLDLRDVITFQGRSVEEIEQAFRDSIDDYLDFCQARGEEPDKPFSGRLMLRLSPHLHRVTYVRARREGKSLNQWIAEKLEQASQPDAAAAANRSTYLRTSCDT